MHKVVLCGHSSFFYSACTVDMKVSHERGLILPALAMTFEEHTATEHESEQKPHGTLSRIILVLPAYALYMLSCGLTVKNPGESRRSDPASRILGTHQVNPRILLLRQLC